MAIHVALNHVTKYRYKKRISLGPQIVRLRPAPHSRTPILSYSLRITPENHFINWQQDPQGNYLARLSFPEKTESFEVAVDLTVNMSVINPFDFFLEESAEQFPFRYEPWLKKELEPFLEAHQASPVFSEYLKQFITAKTPTIDYLVSVIRSLNKDIRYLVRMEPGVQTPEETLKLRSGSCRDSAWLLVQLLRHNGLAARFVSGYLIQLKPDVKSLDGPSGAEQDFTDLHAWAEVYLPGAGWIGLDPTSGLLTGEGHIPLVATPEPSSAAPISGMVEPCEVDFSHDMRIMRFHEDPRVTKPYTDAQWSEILKLGKKVDEDLAAEDVRLTIGGEPTFVSADNMEGAQWNTEALGEEKLKLSETLFKKLKKRWTSGSLIYSGQGKWYPGEPLPRWVMACYWRKDGIPIWKSEALLADLTAKTSYTTADAKKFIEHFASDLGLNTSFIKAGYEDIFYYLWREKRLPANLDPSDAKLKDVLENARLASLFENKLGEPAGYALPLANEGSVKSVQWKSCEWIFKTNHMYLVAGDSPMGLRMPLDSLLWSKEEDQVKTYETDPFSHTGKIHFNPDSLKVVSASPAKTFKKAEIQKGKSAKGVIRTALCVEQRSGRIHIFLPPVSEIEEYLDLIARIEKTAAELNLPVVIEGYSPPHDARIGNFKITPDPGVIEVNVAPVKSWDEMVEQTVSLYEEAHFSRLGTEKFMLDGKHSGTGGGNHVVLGGEVPDQSPFLRRPDLLASVITYWQNHPSLSYLFSGMFIGPTSQAPRTDEGRRDSVYELEIAIRQLYKENEKSGQCPPWIVDRLFRHLLVDGTGNTHRAEICIDKLYSPDSNTGRLGLVEFRGFEMPPHAQMSLAQQLLVRALVVKFWKQPYKKTLIRWDTALHDRFLLPHFVRTDFEEILHDLKLAGYEMKPEYFAPHFEFRFPVIGRMSYGGITAELSAAIEPWYVLGEEPVGGNMSRFVDSSVERIQIKIKGVFSERYVFTCNGRKIPFCRTGTEGEWVAGIRYRAWQPPSCLHPTIPVHTPLTFDMIDTWSRRSVGGCIYHVAHPGGRNYSTFPVNAFEAEARRNARFFNIGHTHGELAEIPGDEINPDYPLTLDLRR